MRLQGRITTWKDDKGLGFITPAGGGEPVFLHVKAFACTALLLIASPELREFLAGFATRIR